MQDDKQKEQLGIEDETDISINMKDLQKEREIRGKQALYRPAGNLNQDLIMSPTTKKYQRRSSVNQNAGKYGTMLR